MNLKQKILNLWKKIYLWIELH